MARGVAKDLSGIFPYSLADGTTRYQVRLRVHGRRVSQSFDTEAQALDFRDELRRAQRRPESNAETPEPRRRGGSAPRRTVFTMIRDEWWEADARTRLDQRTRWTYKSHLKHWIEPSRLGAMDPTAVTVEDIYEWHDWMKERKGVKGRKASPETIRKAQTLLSAAYKWAARRPSQTGVSANPVAAVEWPVEEVQHEVHYFDFETSEWCRQWLERDPEMRDERRRRQSALLFSLMQGTGMRPGEARLMKVSMFDDDFSVLEIPAVVSKTKKARVIPLWQPTQQELAGFVGDYGLRPKSPLIQNARGKPMSFSGWERWRGKSWNRARLWVAAHVDDERLLCARAYDVCRHRYAAAQLAALMPLTDLSPIMGHSVAMLSSTYARPIATAREVRGRGAEPLDPEAELMAAREKVTAEIAKLSPEQLQAPEA